MKKAFIGCECLTFAYLAAVSLTLWLSCFYIHLLRLAVVAVIVSGLSYLLISRFNALWLESNALRIEKALDKSQELKARYRSDLREKTELLEKEKKLRKHFEKEADETGQALDAFKATVDFTKKRIEQVKNENAVLIGANEELVEELKRSVPADQVQQVAVIASEIEETAEERAKALFLSGEVIRAVEELTGLPNKKVRDIRASVFPDEYIWFPDGSYKSKRGKNGKIIKMQEIA